MKEKAACFSGHRVLEAAEKIGLEEKLHREIGELAAAGVNEFFVGGALGFDTLAARCVLRHRDVCPAARLILVFPCREQTAGWRRQDIAVYNQIKRQCDSYLYLQEQYTKDCMFIRNRYLVDSSTHCICYLKQNRGGTFYTVNYARLQGLSVVNLAEQNPQESSLQTRFF